MRAKMIYFVHRAVLQIQYKVSSPNQGPGPCSGLETLYLTSKTAIRNIELEFLKKTACAEVRGICLICLRRFTVPTDCSASSALCHYESK